jgi:hypothetical protein
MSTPSNTPNLWHRVTTLTWLAGAGVLVVALVVTLALTQGASRPASTSLGSASTTPLGEVAGIATPCVGITTLASYEALPVHVRLLRGSEVVSSETVTGDHHYLLAAPPGRYVLTSDQFQRPTSFVVILHGLQTVHVDLRVSCR